jgi:hypothetical protein
MKARLGVAFALTVAVAGCVWLIGVAYGDLNAPPREVLVLKKADLVVQKVTLLSLGGGDFPTGTVEVTVRNRGDGKSPACLLAAIQMQDVESAQRRLVAVTAPIGALEPEAAQTVTLAFEAVGRPWQAMLIVAVDAPGTGKWSGKVAESNEKNNTFGASFNTNDFALPHVLKGPGAD